MIGHKISTAFGSGMSTFFVYIRKIVLLNCHRQIRKTGTWKALQCKPNFSKTMIKEELYGPIQKNQF
jgi:hypothetical protein